MRTHVNLFSPKGRRFQGRSRPSPESTRLTGLRKGSRQGQNGQGQNGQGQNEHAVSRGSEVFGVDMSALGVEPNSILLGGHNVYTPAYANAQISNLAY